MIIGQARCEVWVKGWESRNISRLTRKIEVLNISSETCPSVSSEEVIEEEQETVGEIIWNHVTHMRSAFKAIIKNIHISVCCSLFQHLALIIQDILDKTIIIWLILIRTQELIPFPGANIFTSLVKLSDKIQGVPELGVPKQTLITFLIFVL